MNRQSNERAQQSPITKSGVSVSTRLYQLAGLLNDVQDMVLDGAYEGANEQLGELEQGINECRFALHQTGDTRPMSARGEQ